NAPAGEPSDGRVTLDLSRRQPADLPPLPIPNDALPACPAAVFPAAVFPAAVFPAHHFGRVRSEVRSAGYRVRGSGAFPSSTYVRTCAGGPSWLAGPAMIVMYWRPSSM